MTKIGVFAGSFDPITNGHIWVIEKAAKMVDCLHVVIGVNSAKKYYFTEDERKQQVTKVIHSYLPDTRSKIVVDTISNDLLINYANSISASYIFRGIRNTEDFNYESQIQQVNRKICPTIETVFFIPPSEFAEISSSTVKGIVGFNGWRPIVARYVHPCVLDAFESNISIDKK